MNEWNGYVVTICKSFGFGVYEKKENCLQDKTN